MPTPPLEKRPLFRAFLDYLARGLWDNSSRSEWVEVAGVHSQTLSHWKMKAEHILDAGGIVEDYPYRADELPPAAREWRSRWGREAAIKGAEPRETPVRIPDTVPPKESPHKASLGKEIPVSEDEYSGETWRATRTVDREVKTLEELLEVCGADPVDWTVKRWKCKAWQMAIAPRPEGSTEEGWKLKDTTPILRQLYSVSAELVANREAQCIRRAIEGIIERAGEHAPRYPRLALKPSYEGEGCLLEISIPDVHLRKLSWAPETGANYDCRIAVDTFKRALLDLLAKTAVYPLARILFVVGNDLLNADDSAGHTAHGTPQDVDTRYEKAFVEAFEMLVWGVEQLRLRASVDVVVVRGNHDYLSAWTLGEVLKAHFRHADDVAIDNEPFPRKYYAFGKTLLVFTHGKEEKPHSKLANIAAAERPQMWAAAHWRECHIGHFHRLSAEDVAGFRVRVLPSLCPPDAWHARSGYVGAVRSAEAYVWSGETGLVGTAVFNMPPDHIPASM
ncbi:MAG TPA: hypothetical protein VN519_06915 [Bryobacteraceae bacterium]|nr:hypothetical protein [Bryobacteraceae bacterium]